MWDVRSCDIVENQKKRIDKRVCAHIFLTLIINVSEKDAEKV